MTFSFTDYTSHQIATLTFLPCVTGLLSLLGSSAIVFNIFINRHSKLQKTKNRIILCMSVMDMVQSIASALSTFPAPSDTPGYDYVYGTTETCTMQGFLSGIGYSVAYYNGALCLYYMLTICYGVGENTMRCKIEPFMHLFSFGFPLVAGITSLPLELYNFMGTRCFIASYPMGCSKNNSSSTTTTLDECTRGIDAYLYRWLFHGFWLCLLQLFIPACMFAVFYSVRRKEKQIDRYDRGGSRSGWSLPTTIPSEQQPPPVMPPPPTENQAVYLQWLAREIRGRQRMSRRTRYVATQGLLYVIAYYLAHGWLLICVIVRGVSSGGKTPFTLALLVQLLYPLQGFFNYIIYIRLRVVFVNQNNPERSFLWALKVATFEPTPANELGPGRRLSGRLSLTQ